MDIDSDWELFGEIIDDAQSQGHSADPINVTVIAEEQNSTNSCTSESVGGRDEQDQISFSVKTDDKLSPSESSLESRGPPDPDLLYSSLDEARKEPEQNDLGSSSSSNFYQYTQSVTSPNNHAPLSPVKKISANMSPSSFRKDEIQLNSSSSSADAQRETPELKHHNSLLSAADVGEFVHHKFPNAILSDLDAMDEQNQRSTIIKEILRMDANEMDGSDTSRLTSSDDVVFPKEPSNSSGDHMPSILPTSNDKFQNKSVSFAALPRARPISARPSYDCTRQSKTKLTKSNIEVTDGKSVADQSYFFELPSVASNASESDDSMEVPATSQPCDCRCCLRARLKATPFPELQNIFRDVDCAPCTCRSSTGQVTLTEFSGRSSKHPSEALQDFTESGAVARSKKKVRRRGAESGITPGIARNLSRAQRPKSAAAAFVEPKCDHRNTVVNGSDSRVESGNNPVLKAWLQEKNIEVKLARKRKQMETREKRAIVREQQRELQLRAALSDECVQRWTTRKKKEIKQLTRLAYRDLPSMNVEVEHAPRSYPAGYIPVRSFQPAPDVVVPSAEQEAEYKLQQRPPKKKSPRFKKVVAQTPIYENKYLVSQMQKSHEQWLKDKQDQQKEERIKEQQRSRDVKLQDAMLKEERMRRMQRNLEAKKRVDSNRKKAEAKKQRPQSAPGEATVEKNAYLLENSILGMERPETQGCDAVSAKEQDAEDRVAVKIKFVDEAEGIPHTCAGDELERQLSNLQLTSLGLVDASA